MGYVYLQLCGNFNNHQTRIYVFLPKNLQHIPLHIIMFIVVSSGFVSCLGWGEQKESTVPSLIGRDCTPVRVSSNPQFSQHTNKSIPILLHTRTHSSLLIGVTQHGSSDIHNISYCNIFNQPLHFQFKV
jgi:hypothetical protein